MQLKNPFISSVFLRRATMILSLLLIFIPVMAACQDTGSESKTQPEVSDQSENEPLVNVRHLPAGVMDLPERYKLDSQTGMTVTVREHEKGVDVLLGFRGYRHVSGATRLTRLLMRFPRGKNVFSLSDCKQIYFDRVNGKEVQVDCLNGYLVLDRTHSEMEIDCIVFDEGDWHRFGWNGVWKVEYDPELDTEDILENMGVEQRMNVHDDSGKG
ncbi:hypothetical protein Enr10x_30140 [Gimesia panareensis]|uniref:Lipoprotein n=1 Tax=Gimesia panareensis TaxID=2527978 RepID=A0A517Q7W0_9PLAN|nr:hypothetical protein [Gimesia panareensis]QDT27696.1 hypothetical protein Enr10x_30140 [Gimesia panareensis]